MEILGHGSYLIIDGLHANKNLTNTESLEKLVLTLAKGLEKQKSELTVLTTDTGPSAMAVLPESHVSIHVFSEHKAVSLRVFSRYDLNPEEFLKNLKESFNAKRFSSHLSNHSRTMSTDKTKRARLLQGDRNYTELRLDKNLMF